jgi:protein TonB
VRNEAFDRAVVHALVALDSSQLLPAPSGFGTVIEHDTLPVRLTITGGTVVSAKFTGTFPKKSGVTPLVRLRVPLLRVDHQVAPVAGNPPPRYPYSMRTRGIEGEVQLEFLVRSDSAVDPESILAWKATSIDFLESVLAVLPGMRFYPMQIVGCNVASLVRMPFVFSLNR